MKEGLTCKPQRGEFPPLCIIIAHLKEGNVHSKDFAGCQHHTVLHILRIINLQHPEEITMDDQKDNYSAQKKYLASRKRLSVWMDPDKYERFKALVKENGESIYGLINQFVDDYLEAHRK